MAGRKKQKKQQQDGKPGVNDKEKELRTNTSTNNQQLESSETMSVGNQIAIWAPRIISWLPQIIKAGHDIYALYCRIRDDHRKNEQQDDAVLKAMRLLNKNGDDIDRVLQNPAEKRALMEGLTILMNRINAHDRGQAKGGGDGFGNGKTSPSSKGACGSNGDDSCGYSNGDSCGYGDDSCVGNSLTFEQQIEYAILLSQQEAQVQGASYVERKWQEVVASEEEDMMLAMAIRASEMYEDSRRLAERQAEGGACCRDSMREAELQNAHDDCSVWRQNEHNNENDDDCSRSRHSRNNDDDNDDDCSRWKSSKPGDEYNDDDCSKWKCDKDDCVDGKMDEETKKKHVAFLRNEEEVLIQMAIRASEAELQNGHDDCSVWRQSDHNNENDDDCPRWRHSRSNDDDNDDDCSRWRHSRNNDDNDDDCSRLKSSKPGTEYADDDCSKWKCGKDDCGDGEMDEETKKKHLAFLRDEEEVLIQMAIRASLEEQNDYSDLPALEEDKTDN